MFTVDEEIYLGKEKTPEVMDTFTKVLIYCGK